MGRPKALLPFGSEVMLQRVVRVLDEIVSPLVVVAAPGQELPPLPSEVRIVYDEQEGLGPLPAIAAGLAALPEEVDAAYVSSCDVPLLQPEFVRAIIQSLDGYELAIPRDGAFHHPLAAVYRRGLVPQIQQLVAAGRMRPLFLVRESHANEIDVEQLRPVDPRLDSLRNTNTPDEYQSALRDAGFLP